MGKGQRHSKNAGVMGSEALTYAERRGLGFGTVRERLGKDSFGSYCDCQLTMQPAVDPVVTPHGVLYSREAILENLLAQKKAIKKRMAAWEAAQAAESKKQQENQAVNQAASLVAFDRANHMGISDKSAEAIREAIQQTAAAANGPQVAASVIAIKEREDRRKEMKSFWVPSETPEAETKVEKPDTETYCPATGNKLKLKDLIPVKFTKVPSDSESEGRYMDPVTKDVFTNSHKIVILAPTGDAVLKDTWLKALRQDGHYQGKRIKDKDVIELQTGGTGYAAHDGNKVVSQKHFALGPGSGRQDLRGQHKGARSVGGLVLPN
mmetsp:Transcript_28551/g.77014  ORF Transcript_28551/g.77014 Transcript_28551/m.77014 type:complete len:322 (+) Transcript_28551:159-1124(+)